MKLADIKLGMVVQFAVPDLHPWHHDKAMIVVGKPFTIKGQLSHITLVECLEPNGEIQSIKIQELYHVV